jgi:hypothetical protein
VITVPRMTSVLRKVFEQDARALAREMGVIQRERKLTGTTLLLLLVLGWLHEPKAGPSALARFAGTLGVTLSKQGIEEHWTLTTAQWLYEVLRRAVQCLISGKRGSHPAATALCWSLHRGWQQHPLTRWPGGVLARLSGRQRTGKRDESGRQIDPAPGTQAGNACLDRSCKMAAHTRARASCSTGPWRREPCGSLTWATLP